MQMFRFYLHQRPCTSNPVSIGRSLQICYITSSMNNYLTSKKLIQKSSSYLKWSGNECECNPIVCSATSSKYFPLFSKLLLLSESVQRRQTVEKQHRNTAHYEVPFIYSIHLTPTKHSYTNHISQATLGTFIHHTQIFRKTLHINISYFVHIIFNVH